MTIPNHIIDRIPDISLIRSLTDHFPNLMQHEALSFDIERHKFDIVHNKWGTDIK